MILTRQVRSLFNPEMYQGWGNTRKYFEGWYFKVVKLTRFTTYNGSALRKLAFTDSAAELELENKYYILNVSAPLDQATGLAAPVAGMMNGRIEESMTSVITVTLIDKKTGKTIFSGEGRNASIERSGDTSVLIPR